MTTFSHDTEFLAAWKLKKEQGFQYSDDALENVYLGWLMHRERNDK
jgi:hypothetical protein